MSSNERIKVTREAGSLSKQESDALKSALEETGAIEVDVEEFSPPENQPPADAAWRIAYEPPIPLREPIPDAEPALRKHLEELVRLTEELREKNKKRNDSSSDES